MNVPYPENGPQEQDVHDEWPPRGHRGREPALADRTWIAEGYIACGPEFVFDIGSHPGGSVALTIERRYGQPSCGKVIVYSGIVERLAVHADMSLNTAPAPKLKNWQMRYSPEAADDFDDSSWKSSDDPQQMGADGDASAFAWYRANVNVKTAGHGKLNFKGKADDIVVFVDGIPSDGNMQFVKGENQIAVLASHRGRQKAFNYLGTLNEYHRKGLFGPVKLDIGGETIIVKGWKMRGSAGTIDAVWPAPYSNGSSWGFVPNCPAFCRTTFQDKQVPGRILRLVASRSPAARLGSTATTSALPREDPLPRHVLSRMLAQGRREHARDL